MKTQTSSSPWRWRAGCPEGYNEDQFETEYEDMTGKSNSQKLDFLYALSARINEVAVIADRMGCGEVDPPPLKWSDLKYVLWHQGGSEHAKEETHA